jgi:ribosome-associated protein
MTKTLPQTLPTIPPTSESDPSAALVTVALDALEDLKAVDIRTLDVRGLTTITDYMLIATGTSNRHVSALAHNVLDMARESGRKPVGVEGLAEGEWVLCNLGGVIVHVMQAQARAHYQLERLWDLSPQEMVPIRARQG